MITEEFMKEAALELDGILLDRLPERGELDFSPAFERKMKKLIYRKKHPVMSHPVFRAAAVILLIAVLSSAVILAIPDAQASLKGLFYEAKGRTFSYVLTGVVEEDDPWVYHLGWIPEGYSITEERYSENKGSVRCRNAEGEYIHFYYTIQREDSVTKISRTFTKSLGCRYKETAINGLRANLFEVQYADDDITYTVFWMNEDQSILFSIRCQTMPEAIKIAENVIAKEKE